MRTVVNNRTNGRSATVKGVLAGASSLLAMCACAPAWAQDSTAAGQPQTLPAAEQEAPDIVVTGIRGSLQRNLDIKRNALGVVDVISAEDIGKFPDSNVAASLQRLPGVSIQRAGARGEPQGITVRGFGGDFNETLYDGRRISTASGGRSVDFSTVGSDFVGSLSVLKTPDVSLSTSSIGATVNIEFPKPFDHPGLRLAATGSGSVQDNGGKFVPSGGLLFSDTFAGDTLGVLAYGVYTRHDTKTNRAFNSGWPGGKYAPCQLAGSTATTCAPTSDPTAPASQQSTIVGWFSQQTGASQIYTRDERVDGRIALQWHPSEGVMVTLDNNFSRQTVNADNFGYGIWFNQGALRNVKLDSNGTTVDFTQAGSQTDFTAGHDSTVLQTNQTGLNLKWDKGEHLHFEADGSYAKSWQNPDGRVSSDNADVGYAGTLAPALGLAVVGNSSDTVSVLHDYGPNGNASRYADTSIFGSHVTVRQAQKNTDEVIQFRGSAAWTQDNFSIKIGGRYLEDTYTFQQRNTFTNNFWQAYAGYGPASGSTTGVALPANLFQGLVSTANFIPGYKGALAPYLVRFTPQAYQAYLTSLGNPQAKNIPGFNYGSNNVGTHFTGTFDVALDPGSIQNIREKTWAGYISTSYETEIAGMKFHVNAGAREEITDIVSSGVGQVATGIVRAPGDQTLLTVLFDPNLQPITTKSSYSYLLPSFDVKLELTPKLYLRADASRTLTRPTLNLLTPVLNVGSGQRVGSLTANGGNPTLKPFLSDNFDFAAEWYYHPNSYASVNFFVKNVSNFIVQGTKTQTLNNLIDPSTGQLAQFAVSARVNGPDATIKGVELAWQHVFGSSGFGYNANATFVSTNKGYDPTNLSQSGFAVTGLANSANFVGFFDKNGIEARVAVNWRDKYLLQFGQNQNTGAYGSEPTFVDSSVQVDFSSSYQLTKQVTVFFEALNVTNAVQSTHGRFSNQLLDVFAYGRRFTMGARFRF